MPMHLDISAFRFPGNRWKQCIKAPRGNPGHPGRAKAWPGSGGAGGHLLRALNRFLQTAIPVVSLAFSAGLWREVFISVYSAGILVCHLSAAFSQG